MAKLELATAYSLPLVRLRVVLLQAVAGCSSIPPTHSLPPPTTRAVQPAATSWSEGMSSRLCRAAHCWLVDAPVVLAWDASARVMAVALLA